MTDKDPVEKILTEVRMADASPIVDGSHELVVGRAAVSGQMEAALSTRIDPAFIGSNALVVDHRWNAAFAQRTDPNHAFLAVTELLTDKGRKHVTAALEGVLIKLFENADSKAEHTVVEVDTPNDSITHRIIEVGHLAAEHTGLGELVEFTPRKAVPQLYEAA